MAALTSKFNIRCYINRLENRKLLFNRLPLPCSNVWATFSRPLILRRYFDNLTEDEIKERFRDVSRMAPHMKIRMEKYLQVPDQTVFPYQKTLKHKRRLYAKFGRASGINPGIMWPTLEELRAKVEHEKEWNPTLQEMMEKVQLEKTEWEEKVETRKEELLKNMAEMPKMIKDVEDRRKRKEADMLKLQMKKQRLIDEIQQHFGYRIDPNDEKFQEMLAQKEKEEKKLEKDAKKKAKIARELERLTRVAEKEKVNESKQSSEQIESGTTENRSDTGDAKQTTEEKDSEKTK